MVLLLGLFLVFTGLLAKGYISKVREESRNRISKAVDLTIDHILRGEEIPLELSDPYVFFTIDQKEGSYILERKDKSELSNLIWEQYRTKLTYQMQRQKRGWITYPQLNAWKYFKRSKLIRYSVIEEKNSIVVFEDIMPSDWELFHDVINKKNVSDLMIVLLIGFMLLKFITDKYFQSLMRHIKDASAGSILDFDHAVSKKILPSEEVKESVKRKPLEIYFDEASNIGEKDTIEISDANDLEKYIDQAPVFKSEKAKVKKTVPEVKVDEQRHLAAEAEESSYGHGSDEEELSSGVGDDSSGQWKVSVKGIKSPVLKRMLKELRGQKEKV